MWTPNSKHTHKTANTTRLRSRKVARFLFLYERNVTAVALRQLLRRLQDPVVFLGAGSPVGPRGVPLSPLACG